LFINISVKLGYYHQCDREKISKTSPDWVLVS